MTPEQRARECAEDIAIAIGAETHDPDWIPHIERHLRAAVAEEREEIAAYLQSMCADRPPDAVAALGHALGYLHQVRGKK